ncbi:MAG: glycosyltransferase family 2 protein [bacterium]|nr:glycosyltransferase family 2 protein [bacterium]
MMRGDTPPSAPCVSVVIPTYNRARLVQQAVEHLWSQTLPHDRWEIIVADNCSTDDTPEVVAALQARSTCPMHYRRLTRDGGPSSSRNTGAEAATGQYLVFIDSDVYLDPPWLERAVALADAEPSIGILAGKLVYALRPDCVNVYGGAISRIGLAWDANERQPASAITKPADFLWVATAAVLVRRNVFVELGGFDEDYYYGYEDSDLGWRLNLAGYRCRCVPELVAHHRVSDRPQARGPKITYHSWKNRLRSLLKNYGRRRLVAYLPIYLTYAFVAMLLQRPRWPKVMALWWNLRKLFATLRRRRQIQTTRVCSDKRLDPLFAQRWFPDERVDVRHRRHIELHAGGCVDELETSP